MATDDLDTLRDNLPELFDFGRARDGWETNWVVIPIQDVESADSQPSETLSLNTPGLLPQDYALPEATNNLTAARLPWQASPRLPDIYRPGIVVPGAPRPVPDGTPPPPDALAFYLPYHYFADNLWGIYLFYEGVDQLRSYIQWRTGGAVSSAEAVHVARVFLYAHEAFHHATESFATRLEVDRRTPLYRIGFESLYQRQFSVDRSMEEALATGYAVYKSLYAARRRQMGADARAALRIALEDYVGSLPLSYRAGLEYVMPTHFNRGECQLAEDSHAECFGGPKLLPALWRNAPHAFRGSTNVTSRVNYIVHRDDRILYRDDLGLRFFHYREIVEKFARLAGAQRVREGGNHEVWRTQNGATIAIPRHRTLRSDTIRRMIKQAGLHMSLKEFLAA